MLAGVTVVDPDSTWIDADVEIAADATIEPGCLLRGATTVGADSIIGPHSTLIDSRVGEQARVLHSHLVSAVVGNLANVGPFTYLRPGAELGQGAKAGAFVEIKNSTIGEGAKVPHLSYVGDTEVGDRANVGAGTITANYDGTRKSRTKIGEDARIGVNNVSCRAGERRRRRLHWRRCGDPRGRSGRRARRVEQRAAQYRGLRGAQG